jgi:hypothetical protein
MNLSNGSPGRIDWAAERERIDLAAVATRFLGPAPGRRGERGRKLWWACPFHEDHNPSLCVEPGKPWWRCYGCDAKGDAVDLARRLNPGWSFPEAVAFLVGGPSPTKPGKAVERPAARPRPDPPLRPSGLPEAEALALVEAAAARLWSPEGAEALAYLTGPRRLDVATIRAARLGWTSGVTLPTRDGGTFRTLGWVVPWFDGGRPVLVKLRQPDGCRPKYAEAFRDPVRLACYPNPETVRPGRPLVIVEGEFDALLLGQALGERAAVVTLGSASSGRRNGTGIGSAILGRLLSAAPWYIATDADPAGDNAAAGWPASARRVRPPGFYKDWTEAAADGVDLARWWGDILAGINRPPLFTWNDLAGWRWGPAEGDSAQQSSSLTMTATTDGDLHDVSLDHGD